MIGHTTQGHPGSTPGPDPAAALSAIAANIAPPVLEGLAVDLGEYVAIIGDVAI
jgi:hypothetical protein